MSRDIERHPRLTQADIDALVQTVSYHRDQTLTVAIVHLTNGAVVTGESNVIHPINYDREIGAKIAFDNAKAKIWQLEGYAIKTRGK
ncbi:MULTISPECIES: Gp49 family protein [Marivita]|uniref:Uncharacterized protein n=1 Tax=Marivita cryptomonadis TaxID=505252 RepID=A0A9Q2RYA0_9RHOB|nr:MULTISPECIES: Gp49 family protein [Marivita]MCR9170066.1 Gp49 family protein [Paracoccaceae bacterium]MBM2322667.1 hypothetical protein [Marivita cryptomonadis]MBM2332249.1 hypothetical protein [Marivita cryptomonadis]MBM2341833.1 hypothetical protein [Marivita cryptomonadis]MBM2346497.1 hypothetical protein [Marivita cryptomonadis]